MRKIYSPHIERKKMKTIFTLIIVLMSQIAFASIDSKQLEVLRGYVVTDEGVVFQVYSGGCTGKSNFNLESEQHGNRVYLSLYRNEPDFCKAFFPYGVYLKFSYADLGISRYQSFEIVNPLNPGYRY